MSSAHTLVVEHQLLDSAMIYRRDTPSNFSNIAGANFSVMHLIGAIPRAVTANDNALHRAFSTKLKSVIQANPAAGSVNGSKWN